MRTTQRMRDPRPAAARPTTAQQAIAAGKRRAILAAARRVFLGHGYAGASMDEVAALADVSKVTVYRHFSDKTSLFTAVVTSAIQEAEQTSQSLVDNLGTSVDVEHDLQVFARQHITVVTQPHLMQMRRMIIAEARRFPELARTWHRTGPELAHAKLAEQISRLTQRGLLRAPDPLLAAQNLNYLILSVPMNEAMFTGQDRPFNRRRIHRYADEAIRVFIAAYGSDAAPPEPVPDQHDQT